jgi:hypothetical protein
MSEALHDKLLKFRGTNRVKYNRTMHFSFSQGLQNDDRMLEDESCFDEKWVEVSIKMDGENNSVYNDGFHARSLSSAHHPSRSWMKGFIPSFQKEIPNNWRFIFEAMYAKHSIFYNNLESYAYLINIWNDRNECLSLENTKYWINRLGLVKVPTLAIMKYDAKLIEEIYLDQIAKGEEGIVVRNIESFHYDDFSKNVAKCVRPNHVTTTKHWTSDWIPNKLKT